MRRQFENDLKKLKTKITEMAHLCQEALTLAIDGFISGKTDNVKNVKELEKQIDALEQDIEAACIRFIVQQHPVASDLRNVSTLLKMITDIERIGDQAYDIANLTLETNATYAPKAEHIVEMTQLVLKMLDLAIEGMGSRDLTTLDKVIDLDDQVDQLYYTIKNDIITNIRTATKDEDKIIDILIIAKYLERIADHSTNIAEWVKYFITGSHDE